MRTGIILLLFLGLFAGCLRAPEGTAFASPDNPAAVDLAPACSTDSTGDTSDECCDHCGHVCCLPGAVATVISIVTIAPAPLILAPPTALPERPVPVLLEPPRPTPLR